MAETSKIEWTDATWNPITGCTLVSEGCRNCYAATLAATRLQHHPSRAGLARLNAAGEAKFTGEVRFNEGWLDQPLRWKRPRRIFVCAHGDLFHEAVPDHWIDWVFAVMAVAPQHTFQVLTKRPERMRAYLSDPNARHRVMDWAFDIALALAVNVVLIAAPHLEDQAPPGHRLRLWLWPLPNVWLGVSAEDQATADARIPPLLASPAAVRFVSAEPLLGPMRLDRIEEGIDDYADCGGHPDPHWPEDSVDATWLNALTGRWDAEARSPAGERLGSIDVGLKHRGGKLDWVIVGGESGKGARPMHPDWARSLRDQCAAAGVPFFFKQWGEWAPTSSVDVYCHGPNRNERAHPHADGISWLNDGRVCLRDFPVEQHKRRMARGEATSTRAVEVDHTALDDFHRMVEDLSRAEDNPLGYCWMYCVGKASAGRLLDGVTHDGWP